MAIIGGIDAGPRHPVRIMGVINASPESFYKESIYDTQGAIKDRAKSIEDEGGTYVDVGGMSTAPYLKTTISVAEEASRIRHAIKAVQDGCNLPISIDTCKAPAARAGLEEGAVILNDITGLKYDEPEISRAAGQHGASVILGAYGGPHMQQDIQGTSASDVMVYVTRKLLHQSMSIASDAGISETNIAVDPSIGFFRNDADAKSDAIYTRIPHDWASRDMAILERLESVRDVPTIPILVSVSNKSFLGKITGKNDSACRMYGTIAAETVAVLKGADIIRTHNVSAAKDAILVASGILNRKTAGP